MICCNDFNNNKNNKSNKNKNNNKNNELFWFPMIDTPEKSHGPSHQD